MTDELKRKMIIIVFMTIIIFPAALFFALFVTSQFSSKDQQENIKALLGYDNYDDGTIFEGVKGTVYAIKPQLNKSEDFAKYDDKTYSLMPLGLSEEKFDELRNERNEQVNDNNTNVRSKNFIIIHANTIGEVPKPGTLVQVDLLWEKINIDANELLQTGKAKIIYVFVGGNKFKSYLLICLIFVPAAIIIFYSIVSRRKGDSEETTEEKGARELKKDKSETIVSDTKDTENDWDWKTKTVHEKLDEENKKLPLITVKVIDGPVRNPIGIAPVSIDHSRGIYERYGDIGIGRAASIGKEMHIGLPGEAVGKEHLKINYINDGREEIEIINGSNDILYVTNDMLSGPGTVEPIKLEKGDPPPRFPVHKSMNKFPMRIKIWEYFLLVDVGSKDDS